MKVSSTCRNAWLFLIWHALARSVNEQGLFVAMATKGWSTRLVHESTIVKCMGLLPGGMCMVIPGDWCAPLLQIGVQGGISA